MCLARQISSKIILKICIIFCQLKPRDCVIFPLLRSLRKLKIKKDKETEVTGLQTRTSQASVAPSLAILDKLREEMKNLRESKQNIVPIGKFVLPDGLGQTGLNTDHVDL